MKDLIKRMAEKQEISEEKTSIKFVGSMDITEDINIARLDIEFKTAPSSEQKRALRVLKKLVNMNQKLSFTQIGADRFSIAWEPEI